PRRVKGDGCLTCRSSREDRRQSRKGEGMTPEDKLTELGIALPEATSVHPAMAIGVITGNVLYLSGTTSPGLSGRSWQGRVGETSRVEEGYQAAPECAIQQ